MSYDDQFLKNTAEIKTAINFLRSKDIIAQCPTCRLSACHIGLLDDKYERLLCGRCNLEVRQCDCITKAELIRKVDAIHKLFEVMGVI